MKTTKQLKELTEEFEKEFERNFTPLRYKVCNLQMNRTPFLVFIRKVVEESYRNGREEVVNDMGNLFSCKECREKNRHIISDKYKFF